jgi:flagellar FliL protein
MSSATAEKATDKTADDEKKGGGKKKLIIIFVALLVIGGAVYWFFLKPAGPVPPPEPGEIVTMDATQINLADTHYLRLGIALQLTTTAHEVDGSKALDAAIELFSGKKLEQIEGHKRVALKAKLVKELDHLYHGDVMDVYFTEFVTQ